MWDISAIDNCIELPPLALPPSSASAGVEFFRFMNDANEQILVGFSKKVLLFDARSGSLLKVAEVDGYKAIFCHDVGGSVISVSETGTVQEWDSNFTEVCRHHLGVEVGAVYVAPSGEYVILPQDESNIVFLQPATFLPCRTLDQLPAVYKLRISNDGRKALGWCLGFKVHGLDIEYGSNTFELNRGAMCYSLDVKCIYGSSVDGGMFCLDAETGLPIPSSFTAPATPCRSGYADLTICSSDGVILL
jgi:hypothetical protein